jgi:Ca-activated chloride channel family protein
MFSDFHFLRPWLLALLPVVALLAYWLWRYQPNNSGWQAWLSVHLQQLLLTDHQQQRYSRQHFWLVLLLLVCGVFAAAGPSWQKIPQPAFQLNKATVLVMDMSLSMLATDAKPNRLAQAKFKALDFASQLKEGELALVSFAADAFVISPLTPDHNNIKLLLPDLKPEIMPAQGSNVAEALRLADQLLQQAGYPKGDIVLMTDGFSAGHYQQLRDQLNQFPHRISVLAFGTAEGAPIQLSTGELLKDQRGQIVLPKVALTQLRSLTELTGGVYSRNTFDTSDVTTLLSLKPLDLLQDSNQNAKMMGDQWQDAGVYLLWLLLPLALWLGKRSQLLLLLLCLWQPKTVQAFELNWQDLWQTKQQQAQNAYQQQDYATARQKFSQPLWQGNAAYRDGDYAAAAEHYRQDQSATGQFNLGNSLAQQQQYTEALAAYQQALKQQPDFAKAEQNARLMEKLLAQQQDNQQQQASEGQQQGEQKPGEQQDQQSQSHQQQSEQAQQGEQQQQAQDNAGQQDNPAQANSESAAEQEPQPAQAKPDPATAKDAAESEQAKAQPQEKAVTQAWPNASAEQTQQLDSLMRKVQDDPSLLLRNKMLLEYQKRQQQRLPQGEEQEW